MQIAGQKPRPHVFHRLPRYQDCMRPGILWVECPGWHGVKCGRPHKEYFGPKNRDEAAAGLRFAQHALAVAFLNLKRGRSTQ